MQRSQRTSLALYGLLLGVIALGILVALWSKRDATPAAGGAREAWRADLELQDGRLHRRGEGHPFSGLMIERYNNGMLRSRSAVAQGLLEGRSEGWFTNGELQVVEYFKHGVADGRRTKWHPSGTKLSEGTILAGRFDGLFRKWHENGVLAEQATFSNGLPCGVSLAYFPSGSLKARVTLADGKAVEQAFWKDGESHERWRLTEH